MTTVIQNRITGTDVPVVTKNASVDIETDGDDVLPLDLDGPPTLVVYAVRFRPDSRCGTLILDHSRCGTLSEEMINHSEMKDTGTVIILLFCLQ